MGELNWDDAIQDPNAVAPTITGILAADGDEDEDAGENYTIAELKKGKPLLVYYMNAGNTDANVEGYAFSQALEVKVFQKDKVIDQINKNWRAKKVGLDVESDKKKLENQTRLEFHSFTGIKMAQLTTKDKISSRTVLTRLKKYQAKNASLCKKEIKRLEKQAKLEEQASK